MYNILHIPSTLGVITKCWKDAETELSKVIEEKREYLGDVFKLVKLFREERHACSLRRQVLEYQKKEIRKELRGHIFICH